MAKFKINIILIDTLFKYINPKLISSRSASWYLLEFSKSWFQTNELDLQKEALIKIIELFETWLHTTNDWQIAKDIINSSRYFLMGLENNVVVSTFVQNDINQLYEYCKEYASLVLVNKFSPSVKLLISQAVSTKDDQHVEFNYEFIKHGMYYYLLIKILCDNNQVLYNPLRDNQEQKMQENDLSGKPAPRKGSQQYENYILETYLKGSIGLYEIVQTAKSQKVLNFVIIQLLEDQKVEQNHVLFMECINKTQLSMKVVLAIFQYCPQKYIFEMKFTLRQFLKNISFINFRTIMLGQHSFESEYMILNLVDPELIKEYLINIYKNQQIHDHEWIHNRAVVQILKEQAQMYIKSGILTEKKAIQALNQEINKKYYQQSSFTKTLSNIKFLPKKVVEKFIDFRFPKLHYVLSIISCGTYNPMIDNHVLSHLQTTIIGTQIKGKYNFVINKELKNFMNKQTLQSFTEAYNSLVFNVYQYQQENGMIMFLQDFLYNQDDDDILEVLINILQEKYKQINKKSKCIILEDPQKLIQKKSILLVKEIAYNLTYFSSQINQEFLYVKNNVEMHRISTQDDNLIKQQVQNFVNNVYNFYCICSNPEKYNQRENSIVEIKLFIQQFIINRIVTNLKLIQLLDETLFSIVFQLYQIPFYTQPIKQNIEIQQLATDTTVKILPLLITCCQKEQAKYMTFSCIQKYQVLQDKQDLPENSLIGIIKILCKQIDSKEGKNLEVNYTNIFYLAQTCYELHIAKYQEQRNIVRQEQIKKCIVLLKSKTQYKQLLYLFQDIMVK